MGNFLVNTGSKEAVKARAKRGWEWGSDTGWQSDKKQRRYWLNTIYNETIDPWYLPQLKRRWAGSIVFLYWVIIWSPPWLLGNLYTSSLAHVS